MARRAAITTSTSSSIRPTGPPTSSRCWPAPSSAPGPSSSTRAPRRPPSDCVTSESDARCAEHFGAAPRWQSRAPGRVNLIGEHVDYMGGLVLPAAVDRFIWLSGAPARRWEMASEGEGGEDYLQGVAGGLGGGPP